MQVHQTSRGERQRQRQGATRAAAVEVTGTGMLAQPLLARTVATSHSVRVPAARAPERGSADT